MLNYVGESPPSRRQGAVEIERQPIVLAPRLIGDRLTQDEKQVATVVRQREADDVGQKVVCIPVRRQIAAFCGIVRMGVHTRIVRCILRAFESNDDATEKKLASM